MGFSLTNVITRKSTHLTVRSKSFAVWLGVWVMAALFMPFVKGIIPAPNSFSVSHWLIMLLIALLVIAATLLVQYGVTLITAPRRKQRGINYASQPTGFQPASPQVEGNST